MENIPPSYESAVTRNPWGIIAPYIPSAELCALNRVSRELHQVFAPCLWGNPASHFGTENDRVYVALTRFRRTLKRVRLNVRELTHTLHLPPALSEIYDGPHPEWLRAVLEQLPNLQSLIVSRLPFFDHMALLALRSHSNGCRPTLKDEGRAFSLRLLIAAYCQNTTSQGLAEALACFTNLAFLDLSNIQAARDRCVLSGLQNLPLIQVLKLRNIHLRDEDLEILADSIGIKVRSLDVQGNHLTDRGVSILLSTSFHVEDQPNGLSDGRPSSNQALEDWPAGFVRPDPAVLDEFKDESYDERFVRRLTSGIVSRLPYEDLPYTGITHLYIADNNLTVEGVAALVMSKRLFVLDVGTVNVGVRKTQPLLAASRSLPALDTRLISFPGLEKLTPVLGKCAESMTSLRINHTIVTENAPPKDENPVLATCELGTETAKQELDVPMPAELDAGVYEIEGKPPLYELDNGEPQPRYELPGDSMHFIVSPSVGEKPSLSREESQPQPRRGSAFAPEVVESLEPNDDATPVLTATGLGSIAQAINGVSGTSNSKFFQVDAEGSSSGRVDIEMQRALIEKQRRELRSNCLAKPHGLVPGMLPRLRTITLTDVPCFEKARHAVDALIQFIRDCASEAQLAKLQARLEPSPAPKRGQRQPVPNGHGAREIFALRRVILEMDPSDPSSVANNTPISKYAKRTKSSTEDPDSEAFWSAAENDFTFFDEDEECGLPSIEPDSYLPYSTLSEKITTPIPPVTRLPASRNAKEPLIDVVQELAKFRRERKAAYEHAVKMGAQHVDGYWPGEVKVVRGHYSGGKMDYYGNRFEKGGVYR